MPRNMSVSRERLAPSSSSEKSQEIHGAVSGRSSAANSSTNLHLSVVSSNISPGALNASGMKCVIYTYDHFNCFQLAAH